MQTKRNLPLCQKKPQFTSYPESKLNKLPVTDVREKPVVFFNDTARASTLAPAIILQA